MEFVINMLMFLVAVFLILLVLVQRGRGGGLAGALGGMGGQSAFGTKAGDLFTRITIVVAAVWILLCVGVVKYYSGRETTPQGLGVAASAEPGTALPGAPGFKSGDGTSSEGASTTSTTGALPGGEKQPAEKPDAATPPATEKPAAKTSTDTTPTAPKD